ncbi:hypothetical protein AJ87_07575 [Rhizobium yanglingense]|nr:hypothetical protein AJ87_07575 [Rhizobium yanglingense]
MTRPDLKLPDDVETLKAMVLAMAEKAARADALESEAANVNAPDGGAFVALTVLQLGQNHNFAPIRPDSMGRRGRIYPGVNSP